MTKKDAGARRFPVVADAVMWQQRQMLLGRVVWKKGNFSHQRADTALGGVAQRGGKISSPEVLRLSCTKSG